MPEEWTWRPRCDFKPRILRAEEALLHNYTAGMIFDSLTMVKPLSLIWISRSSAWKNSPLGSVVLACPS